MVSSSTRLYPTIYLRPTTQSKIVREVVYYELRDLAEYRARPDILSVAKSLIEIDKVYRKLEYDLPSLLSYFQEIDVKEKSKSRVSTVSVSSVPWEIVPVEIVARCLDDSMSLTITDELLEFLNFKPTSSIFDRVLFRSRVASGQELIESPVYNRAGKKIAVERYFYDESEGDFVRAIVGDCHSNMKTSKELEFVLDHFDKDSPSVDERTGIPNKLIHQIIYSISESLGRYRREYLKHNFIEDFKTCTVQQIHERRDAVEREFIATRNGRYREDTSALWNLVKESKNEK